MRDKNLVLGGEEFSNTAIAGAQDPVAMARARLAVESGRLACRAGRIAKKLYATASSPLEGLSDWASS